MAKTHARHSPSTLTALQGCLRFKYSDKDEDSADEGTELHLSFQTGNLSGLDDEQKACVQAAIDYTASLMEGKPEDWYELKEVRVALQDLTYGTADELLIHKTDGRAHVLDFKSTRIVKSHALQINTYGAAAVEMIKSGTDFKDHDGVLLLAAKSLKPLTQVTTHIVAPRTRTIDAVSYAADDLLLQTRKEIEDLYLKIEDPFEAPTPSEGLCDKCARAAKCPALGVVAVTAAQGIGLPLPSTFAPDAVVSVEDRARAQIIAGALENWSSEIKKQNNEFAKNGGEIPGFTLRTRSNGIKVAKEFTPAVLDILKEAGYNETLVLESCSLTIGDLVKKQALATQVPEAAVKEALKELLADWTTESVSEFLSKSKRTDDATMLKQLEA